VRCADCSYMYGRRRGGMEGTCVCVTMSCWSYGRRRGGRVSV